MATYTTEQVQEYLATYAVLESAHAHGGLLRAPHLTESTLLQYHAILKRAQNVPEELRNPDFQTELSELEKQLQHYNTKGDRILDIVKTVA